jgi:hypothetical protein
VLASVSSPTFHKKARTDYYLIVRVTFGFCCAANTGGIGEQVPRCYGKDQRSSRHDIDDDIIIGD